MPKNTGRTVPANASRSRIRAVHYRRHPRRFDRQGPTKTLLISTSRSRRSCLPGVDPKILDPRDTYKNAKAIGQGRRPANRFVKNFAVHGNEEGKLVAAGPKIISE